MLSNIGKDTTDIAVLQARLNALETDQLSEKTRSMIQVSLMEDEVRALKEEVRALRKEAVLLLDARGNPIDLEPVTQFEGRTVFKIPRDVLDCVVNKSLRLSQLSYGHADLVSGSPCQLENSLDGFNDFSKMSYKDDHFTGKIMAYRGYLCFKGEKIKFPFQKWPGNTYGKVYLVEAI